MDRGMLWFDNNPKIDIKTKIREAANYYRKKYGSNPNLCFVNPKEMEREITMDNKINVRPYRSVLPGHIWIGFSEGSSV